MARYLTKSKYALALECPTKLFYTGKKREYVDGKVDDAFLKALARGGFQVGALAQAYYPGGIAVEEIEHDAAVAKTEELLKRGDVTIFEAAIRHGSLFVRVDVLEKKGDRVRLIEVKAKSYDPKKPLFELDAGGNLDIANGYDKYVYDVTFQTHVMKLAHPELKVSSFLMLTDKSVEATVDGLNQLFVLKEDESGRTYVEAKTAGMTAAKLGQRVLIEVNVDAAANAIFADKDLGRPKDARCEGLSYAKEVAYLAEKYVADAKIPSVPGAQCGSCEFRTAAEPPMKSGFDECWTSKAKVKKAELTQPFIFDLWDNRRVGKLIEAKKYFLKDLSKDDIGYAEDGKKAGMSRTQRQWLQIESAVKGRTEPVVDVAGLKAAMKGWEFPLHFIDFETLRPAIPFSKGRRSYEQIAFQFSHHIVHADGTVVHANEYFNDKRGDFPNFEFVRKLKDALGDEGTIFRYATHENTVLCEIHEQLSRSADPEKAVLMAWIETITKSSDKAAVKWRGKREMVDLLEIVKSFYYHPSMGGSNSIKDVLPAILRDSAELRSRYEQKVYGAPGGIKSKNFQSWAWIQYDASGQVKDPYELLPKVYEDFTPEQLDEAMGESDVADGGAAMTAYAMMQFTEMSDHERGKLREALLKYCELDTFAMVLLYQYWQEFVSGRRMPTAA